MLPSEDRSPKIPPFEVHRIKGRVPLTSGRTMLLQGVREVFELIDAADRAGAPPSDDTAAGARLKHEDRGKIVVIGRALDHSAWQSSLDSVLQQRP